MPDSELVFGIVEGRIDFARFVERFERGVYKMMYALVKNAADAEELTQDVFVRLLDLLRTYDPKRGSVRKWLHSIAYKRAMSHLRKRQRSPLSLDIMTDSQGPSDAGPAELHEANERSARLRQTFGGLDPLDQAVFVGFHVRRLPWKVVAAENNCTKRHARYRALVALRKLRESL